MAIQAIWVPGSAVVPTFVGWRGDGDRILNGLVKARYDSSVVQISGDGLRDAEIDWSEVVGLRGPGGAAFRGQANKNQTFTFPIPSPVFRSPGTSSSRDPNRARLLKVFLLCSAQSGVRLNWLHVMDAGTVLLTQSLDIRGDALRGDHPNSWTINGPRPSDAGPEVKFGVSIGVQVHFGDNEANNQIVFRAAGADFEV